MLKVGQIFVVLTVVQLVVTSKPSYETEYKKNGSLFLTPLIEANNLSLARKIAAVESFVAGVSIESYAGYLTVDKRYNSNLFFWMFQSETDWKSAPVAVWLQGGPGYSGLYGLFNELGPYEFVNEKLAAREHSWHRECNLIFIDSPVGSCYSYTNSSEGYARNQSDVAEDLYQAMVQIFKLFPELQSNPFYISGESYAGKYVPSLGHAIHQHNPTADLKINLQGMLIGNGLTDPVNMIPLYGEQLYALGLIDYNERLQFEELQDRTVTAIRSEEWLEAVDLYTQLIIGYTFNPYRTLYTNTTGLLPYYNFMNETSAKWMPYEDYFMKSDVFKHAVHIGDVECDGGNRTRLFMKEDIAKSVIGLVAELVEHYKIVFYNGQLDVICAYPLTENFLRLMEWTGAERYRDATRRKWLVEGELAGYVRTVDNLSDVLVRKAGHMVPTDQPLWAYELFNSFVHNRSLTLRDRTVERD